jgi:hypothetical protein
MMEHDPAQLVAQSGSAAVNYQMSTIWPAATLYTTPHAERWRPVAIRDHSRGGTGRILRVDASGTPPSAPARTCGTPNPDGPSIGGTDWFRRAQSQAFLRRHPAFSPVYFLGASLPGALLQPAGFQCSRTNFATPDGDTLGQTFFIGDGFATGGFQQTILRA